MHRFRSLAFEVFHQMHPALMACLHRLWAKKLVLTSTSNIPLYLPYMCQGMEGRICVAPLRSDDTLTVLGGD